MFSLCADFAFVKRLLCVLNEVEIYHEYAYSILSEKLPQLMIIFIIF